MKVPTSQNRIPLIPLFYLKNMMCDKKSLLQQDLI
jgi:hypothetical protein